MVTVKLFCSVNFHNPLKFKMQIKQHLLLFTVMIIERTLLESYIIINLSLSIARGELTNQTYLTDTSVSNVTYRAVTRHAI